jgi:hypothetical protein
LIVEDDQIRHFPFIILAAVSQQPTANCQQRLFSRGSKLVARGFFRLFANSQQLKANSWLFFPFLCLSSSYHLKNKTICDISNLFAY